MPTIPFIASRGVTLPQRLIQCTVCAATLVVAGCGGGSSDATDPNNIFKDKVGVYTSGCSSESPFPGSPDSTKVTLTLSDPAGTDKINAVFRLQNYSASTVCNPSNLTNDVTVTGTVQALAGTKAMNPITASLNGGRTGTAKTASFNLTVLPTQLVGLIPNSWVPDMTTTIGYLFDGNDFYALTNPKGESDGLGAYFSHIKLTKQ